MRASTMPRRRPAPGIHRGISVFAVALGCLLLSGCPRREAAPAGQILRVSQRNEPATLDPQLATLADEFFIIRALGEGLLTPNPDGGAPLPGVASKWEVSADGLIYTFHLRPEAKWSNGDPVTAMDFRFTCLEALLPARAAPKASLFFPIKHAKDFYAGKFSDVSKIGIAVPDPHTLVLSLETPKPDFPAIVASGPWIPRHRDNIGCLNIGPNNASERLSNGPFMLVEWSPNRRIVVRKNPAYWNPAAIRLDAIHFLAFDSSDTEERAFRAGQLDVTMTVPFAKLDSYRRNAPELMQTVPLHETRYLALNTTRPPLNDRRVRQALSLALERQALVDKVLKGGQRPAFNYVPPGLGGFAPVARLAEDAAEARRLLAAAGFPGGQGFPVLELSSWGASSNLVPETIQQRWRTELGVTVTLVQREARTHLAALATGDYDLAVVAAIPDYDGAADLLQELTTGDATNYPHWSNPAYDQLATAGPPAAAERMLLEELPVIPLYFNAKSLLRRPAVRGWREDALWTRYYHDVYLDEK